MDVNAPRVLVKNGRVVALLAVVKAFNVEVSFRSTRFQAIVESFAPSFGEVVTTAVERQLEAVESHTAQVSKWNTLLKLVLGPDRKRRQPVFSIDSVSNIEKIVKEVGLHQAVNDAESGKLF